MPDWSSITVSVSTHLIFRYHLPLSISKPPPSFTQVLRGYISAMDKERFDAILFSWWLTLLLIEDGGGEVGSCALYNVHTVLSPSRQTHGWWWWWDCCTHSLLTWQANCWLMVVVRLLYTQSSHLAGKFLAVDGGGGIVVHTVLSPGRETPGW